MKKQITPTDQVMINSIQQQEEKKSRKEVYGTKNTRYKRTGYEVFLKDRVNLSPPPYGYNYALGYCQDTVQQDNSVI